jgi:hypothetical protein
MKQLVRIKIFAKICLKSCHILCNTFHLTLKFVLLFILLSILVDNVHSQFPRSRITHTKNIQINKVKKNIHVLVCKNGTIQIVEKCPKWIPLK